MIKSAISRGLASTSRAHLFRIVTTACRFISCARLTHPFSLIRALHKSRSGRPRERPSADRGVANFSTAFLKDPTDNCSSMELSVDNRGYKRWALGRSRVHPARSALRRVRMPALTEAAVITQVKKHPAAYLRAPDLPVVLFCRAGCERPAPANRPADHGDRRQTH